LAISRAVSVALSEASQRERRRISQAREALKRAARGLATTLAGWIEGWVALVDSAGELAAAHSAPSPLPDEVGDLLGTLRTGSGIRTATTELPGGTFVVAQPVYPQATASHLLVVGRRRRFDGTARSIVAVGAALLGLVGWGARMPSNSVPRRRRCYSAGRMRIPWSPRCSAARTGT
jgi:hypothetical protein